MKSRRAVADIGSMIWPAAALAVLLLGFVVVYGSVLQARQASMARDEPIGETHSA